MSLDFIICVIKPCRTATQCLLIQRRHEHDSHVTHVTTSRHTYASVMSHKEVTHMIKTCRTSCHKVPPQSKTSQIWKPCHTHDYITSPICHSHVTQRGHTHVMSHTWLHHVTHLLRNVTHMTTSRHTYTSVIAHSDVTHMTTSRLTYTPVIAHSDVTHMTKSCHTSCHTSCHKVPPQSTTSHIQKPCHTYIKATSHIWLCHGGGAGFPLEFIILSWRKL